MSTVYVCQGKQCPLRETNPTGLAIIPPQDPRWTMTIVLDFGEADRTKLGVHLCKDCVWAIREMVTE